MYDRWLRSKFKLAGKKLWTKKLTVTFRTIFETECECELCVVFKKFIRKRVPPAVVTLLKKVISYLLIFLKGTYICSLLQSLVELVNSIVWLTEIRMPSPYIKPAGNVKPLIDYRWKIKNLHEFEMKMWRIYLGSSLSTWGPPIMWGCPGPPSELLMLFIGCPWWPCPWNWPEGPMKGGPLKLFGGPPGPNWGPKAGPELPGLPNWGPLFDGEPKGPLAPAGPLKGGPWEFCCGGGKPEDGGPGPGVEEPTKMYCIQITNKTIKLSYCSYLMVLVMLCIVVCLSQAEVLLNYCFI